MNSEDIESGFIAFFNRLPLHSKKLLRFFERKDGQVFSVHGKDALFVAETVYKTSTVLKYYGSQTVPTCTLSKVVGYQLIRDLLLYRGYSVEIWELDNKKWIASPGNLKDIEDELFSNSDLASSPVVCAINVEQQKDQSVVGVCFTDASSSMILGITEFVDNEAFSNLESLLIQQNIKECIIPGDVQSYEVIQIQRVVQKCDIVITETKKQAFQTKNIVQDLNRLLETGTNVEGLAELELQVAMSSTACIIDYLDLLNDETRLGNYKLLQMDLSQYMRLDSSAVQALNLNPGPKDGNKNMNLFGLLNHCKTAQGSRLLGQWIKQPLMKLNEITQRQDFVELFTKDMGLRQAVKESSLKSFPDLHRLAKKFQRKKSNLQNVVRVYQVVTSLPRLIESLDQYDGDHQKLVKDHLVSKLQEFYDHLVKLVELVESTIDLNALDNHEYIIKADFDPKLKAIKENMDDITTKLQVEAKRFASRVDLEFDKKIKFEHNCQYGHHLRVSRQDVGKVNGEKDFIELRTQKAGCLFTIPTLKRLSSEHNDLGKEYQQLSSSISKEIIAITGTYFPVLQDTNRLIAELDVYVSLATVAASAPIPYIRPKVSVNGDLILKGSRHPCVEMQDDVSFIDNDISLINGKSMFHIITGPNMGGKSTFIRQVGVITLMAQIGSFVPAEEAVIRIVDSILARVGAGDSQLKGISTFMAEMLETAAILRTATDRSLIIIDELGRGTSTKDGFGLAWSIAEYISKQLDCFTLFATHFHEITKLSDMVPIVENYHVQAHVENDKDRKSFTLLYKVIQGSCDQSFGIHVAELARFPKCVIQLAKRKASQLEEFEAGDIKKWKSINYSQEGTKLITDFLGEYRKDPSQLQALKDKYQDQFNSNPFVQEVINEF